MEFVLRNRWIWLVAGTLLSAILLLILLWPEPIQTTQLGEYLANWAASIFENENQNKSQVLANLEVWLNFLIFIPFAMVIFFFARRFRVVVALSGSLLLSSGAELTQKYLLVERVATIQDVLLNFSGAIVGVIFAQIISRVGKTIRTSRSK